MKPVILSTLVLLMIHPVEANTICDQFQIIADHCLKLSKSESIQEQEKDFVKILGELNQRISEKDFSDVTYSLFSKLENKHSSTDSINVYYVYFLQGIYFQRVELQDKSINAFKWALKMSRAESSLNHAIYYYLGLLYVYSKEYEKAIYHYEKAEQLVNTACKDLLSKIYNGMAFVSLVKQEYEVAEQHYLKSSELMIYNRDTLGLSIVYNNLGNLAFEQYQDEKAKSYFLQSLGTLKTADSSNIRRDVYKNLYFVTYALGEYKSASNFLFQYTELQDSIWNRDKIWELAEKNKEIAVAKREQEITILEREKELQRTYVAIAFILLVLSGVVILYFRQRFYNTELRAKAERKEHEDEIYDLLKSQETKALQSMVKGKEEERQHLAKELHNHLGSLLATVKVNLNGLDQNQEGNKLDTIIDLVDQATQDVRNMSHELHMGVSENFGLIPALQELVGHLERSKQLLTKLSADLGAVHISSEDEILIYRIVQELVSNVLKHAGATQLTISLTGFEEDNLISIMVEDNGKGFDPENLQKYDKGIGLDSLEAMIHQLEGEIHIDSSNGRGSTINVDIPFAIPENLDTN